MRKGLLAIAAMMLVVGSASAQGWGFGPKVGATFANVNGLENSKMKAGVVAGMFAERDVNSWFSVQAELLWSQQGFRLNTDGMSNEVRLSYIYMPVVTKYYLLGGLNMQLGAQFGYLATSKVTGAEGYSIKNGINKYNVDMLVGLAYDFKCGMIIEGRYNIGLTNLSRYAEMSDASGAALQAEDWRNGTLQVTLGWKF